MTLTASDSAALSFYEEWMSYVSGFGLFNLEREERRLFNQGKRIAQQVAALAKSVASAGGTRWTGEEYDSMAEAYILHGRDRGACLRYFRAQGHVRHTDDAITFAAYSCAALDVRMPEVSGFKDYANGLLGALQALDSQRFRGVTR
jgi:hypothetical protein